MARAAAGPRDHAAGLGAPVDGQRARATLALLGLALVWGTTYSAVKDAVEGVGRRPPHSGARDGGRVRCADLAQRRLSPSRLGLLLATEPMFAVLVAV